MLYAPFWIILIIHAEVFWYYLVLPLTMFIIEKILGSRLIKKARYGDIFITEVGLLPSGVSSSGCVFSLPGSSTFWPSSSYARESGMRCIYLSLFLRCHIKHLFLINHFQWQNVWWAKTISLGFFFLIAVICFILDQQL